MVAWRGFRLGGIATVTRLAVRPCENNIERSSWINAVELGGFDQRIMCASDSGDLSPPPDARISIKTEPASLARTLRLHIHELTADLNFSNATSALDRTLGSRCFSEIFSKAT